MDPIQKLFEDIVTFLSDRTDPQKLNTGSFSLFEIACLGNPEKTIQGELLSYLRAKEWKAVIEWGFSVGTIRRHIDLLVFSPDVSSPDGQSLLAIIELKHFTENQGPADKLIEGLVADIIKDRPENLPLIQIGLYTRIVNAINHKMPNNPYRLLGYYKMPLNPKAPNAFPNFVSKYIQTITKTKVVQKCCWSDPNNILFSYPKCIVEGNVSWAVFHIQ